MQRNTHYMQKTTPNNLFASTIACIILAGLVYFLIKGHTIYQGWGGDYAGYVNQARYIVEGKSLIKEATYIYNPAIPHLAPPAYPMGFSMFLAPFYKVFGCDMDVFSILASITLGLFGVGVFVFLQKQFGTWVALGATVLFCLNPYFYQPKGFVLPDYYFGFLQIMAVYAYCYREKTVWQNALVCGVLAGLAWLTRANGIVLIGIVAIDLVFQQAYDMFKARRWNIDKSALRYLTVFLVTAISIPTVVHHIIWPLPQGGSYFDQLHFGADFWGKTWGQARDLFRGIKRTYTLEPQMPFMYKTMLDAPFTYILTAGAVVFAFTALGILTIRNRVERFLLLYLLAFCFILSVWPMVQGVRYFVPIIPIVYYFNLKGFQVLHSQYTWLNGLKWAAVFAVFAPAFYHIDKKVFEVLDMEEIGSPQYRLNTEAFDWVKQNTPKDAVFAAHHPLIFGLYTDRKSFKWRKYRSPDEIMEEYKQFNAAYVVINLWELDTDKSLQEFMKKYESTMTKLWENERNIVYKLASNE